MTEERQRCEAVIFKPDTYRYTGRVKGGFQMHYRRDQCSRVAVEDGLCWQHRAMGRNILRWGQR